MYVFFSLMYVQTDHCTVVDEAVRYIKSLEHTLQTAQNQRLHKLRGSTCSSMTSKTEASTDVGVTRREAHFQEEDRPSKKLAAVRNTLNFQQASCFKTWFSPNVVMNMCGDEAHISVCSPRRPGLLSTVFYILEKHKLDVISAHISSDQHRCMYMIHAHYVSVRISCLICKQGKNLLHYLVPNYVFICNDQAGGGACDNLPGELSVEDTFKLAAGEMNLCLLSS